MDHKVYVVGIGYSVLSERARDALLSSVRILTSSRLMEVLERYPIFQEIRDKVLIIEGVDNTISYLTNWAKEKAEDIAVLASGDPMFYGIGRRIAHEIGKKDVEIISELSCIQLAFARIKEPWDNAFLMSVHGGPFPHKRINRYAVEDIPYLVKLHGRVCILTDPINNPTLIAKTLTEYFDKNEHIRMYVAERLGYGDEKVHEGNPCELSDKEFQEPNVVIVIWDDFKPSKRCGFQTSEIIHERGLITKDEIRAVIINKLFPPQRGVVWDIGAGSGSVSLELSMLYPELDIFSIEKKEEMVSLLKENKKKFKARYKVIAGEAPEILENLPLPDRVFVGGSGQRLYDIIDFLLAKPIMHIVFAVTLFDNLNTIVKSIPNELYHLEVTQICSFNSRDLADSWYLVPQNPVFLLLARKR